MTVRPRVPNTQKLAIYQTNISPCYCVAYFPDEKDFAEKQRDELQAKSLKSSFALV